MRNEGDSTGKSLDPFKGNTAHDTLGSRGSMSLILATDSTKPHLPVGAPACARSSSRRWQLH